MKAILNIYLGEQWREYVAYNRVTADFRLDEQLDTGNIMIITDSAEPISPMSAANLELTDGDNSVYFPCYCFDRVEVRGQGYYVHNLTLVEPTRRLMGILIDGVKVTQPTEEEQAQGEAKKSLYEVTERLLHTYMLNDTELDAECAMPVEHEVVSLLKNTESPEFQWEAETQLWECLKDIGDVINCMPRLTFNAEHTALNTLTFDRINDVTEERELG